MNKISPTLWMDNEGEEAANFYLSLFKNSKIGKITRYSKAGFEIHGQPEGKVMSVEFALDGTEFMIINGGPIFKINPSISFLIACETKEEVDMFWSKLSEGGKSLMELGSYPFSERYGWTNDKFGVSWQIIYMNGQKIDHKITPTLMFTKDKAGKAEEAINFYTSVFKDTAIDHVMKYNPGEDPDAPGTIRHASFKLAGQWFAAMDSARVHDFAFSEAVSLLIRIENEEENDYYWSKLTEGSDPSSWQCGWLKDKFGVSWQVAPVILDEMLRDPDKEKVERVTKSFLVMKKIDMAEIKRVYEGK